MCKAIRNILNIKIVLALLAISLSGNAFLAYKLFSMTIRQEVQIEAPKSDQEKYERSRQLNSQIGVTKSSPIKFN